MPPSQARQPPAALRTPVFVATILDVRAEVPLPLPSLPDNDAQLAFIARCVARLRAWLQSQDYSGFDPYDGLQSRVFQALPFRNSKWARTAMIQAMKR